MGNASVMTIQGPVDAGELGVTLIHEHLFLDMRPAYAGTPETDEEREVYDKPLTIELLGRVRRDFGLVPTVLALDDLETMVEEVSAFKELGGSTIVDVTPIGIHVPREGFRPATHLELARRTGLNVIFGCGHYVQPAHPPDVAGKSVEQLADEIVQEITEGIGDTGVRPGVIGEIGLSEPAHPDEWKCLEAACRAQLATGLPLTIHPYFGTRQRIAPEIGRFVIRQGVDPGRVNFCHMEGYHNVDYQRRVLDMGFWFSFDTWGLEVYYDKFDFNHNCHDSQRKDQLIRLLDLGYADQLLISQDVCTKLQLVRFGGYGYGHILRNIVPALRYEGVTEATIERLLVENPRRWLAGEDTAARGGEAVAALAGATTGGE